MLKFGKLVQYGPAEATEWLQSTFGRIQDSRRCPIVKINNLLHYGPCEWSRDWRDGRPQVAMQR